MSQSDPNQSNQAAAEAAAAAAAAAEAAQQANAEQSGETGGGSGGFNAWDALGQAAAGLPGVLDDLGVQWPGSGGGGGGDTPPSTFPGRFPRVTNPRGLRPTSPLTQPRTDLQDYTPSSGGGGGGGGGESGQNYVLFAAIGAAVLALAALLAGQRKGKK